MKILILGGNRFIGKQLADELSMNHNVSILNRGNQLNDLTNVSNILCDRKDFRKFQNALADQEWDIVFDHCCYDASDANNSCKVFNGRIKRYFFISSQYVYPEGQNLSEEDFDPKEYNYKEEIKSQENYGEGKKQAESVFFKLANFQVIALRFPVIIGLNDHTKRLLFYIKKILNNELIYFSNLNAKISFLHSSDAVSSLKSLLSINYRGPLNICAYQPIKIRDFIKIIENTLKKKAKINSSTNQICPSPYGFERDWFMNSELSYSLGIRPREIESFLPNLILEIIKKNSLISI